MISRESRWATVSAWRVTRTESTSVTGVSGTILINHCKSPCRLCGGGGKGVCHSFSPPAILTSFLVSNQCVLIRLQAIGFNLRLIIAPHSHDSINRRFFSLHYYYTWKILWGSLDSTFSWSALRTRFFLARTVFFFTPSPLFALSFHYFYYWAFPPFAAEWFFLIFPIRIIIEQETSAFGAFRRTRDWDLWMLGINRWS